MTDDIAQKVYQLVAERMDVDESQVNADTHFVNDLQSDSLDMAELVIDMEEEFNISISDEEAQNIQTVGQAVEYINANSQ